MTQGIFKVFLVHTKWKWSLFYRIFFIYFREWTNGVLTVAALEAVDEPSEVNTWIVCDGDIDPEWVESLNSVLGKFLDLFGF